MGSNRTHVGKLVGRIGDEYYFCDTVFYHTDFKGAIATVLRPVGKKEYEAMTDPESDEVAGRFEDVWIEQVKAGQTQESLKDFCKMVIDVDGEEALWDHSGYEYWEILREAPTELAEEDYPVFECIGGGRSFSVGMEWDEIYDAEAWALIQEYEAK